MTTDRGMQEMRSTGKQPTETRASVAQRKAHYDELTAIV